jgi:hypothetical protein
MQQAIVGYVVSNDQGHVELETHDLAEAFSYRDALNQEDLTVAIGALFADGSTSFGFPPRRPAAGLDME